MLVHKCQNVIYWTKFSDCTSAQFGCISGSSDKFARFPDYYVCDDYADCKDNSDEVACAELAESGELHICYTMHCVVPNITSCITTWWWLI